MSRHCREQMVLDLEVEMTSKPVIEPRGVDIASSHILQGGPIPIPVIINVHWDVIHLGDVNKPMTLEHAIKDVERESTPEPKNRLVEQEVLSEKGTHQKQIHPFSMSKAIPDVIDVEVRGQQEGRAYEVPIMMLEAVWHKSFLQQSPSARELFADNKYVRHPDVWILVDGVGLSMMQEVTPVPPKRGMRL